MPSLNQIQQSWKKLLGSIQNPLPMRPGSITQQRPKVRQKDGTVRLKGPYPLYTLKKKGKTVSRILREEELPAYRQSVDNFHGFLAAVEQMKALGLALAEGENPDQKKTPAADRKGKRHGGAADSGASGR